MLDAGVPVVISIHAPNMGSGKRPTAFPAGFSAFQSPLPVRIINRRVCIWLHFKSSLLHIILCKVGIGVIGYIIRIG